MNNKRNSDRAARSGGTTMVTIHPSAANRTDLLLLHHAANAGGDSAAARCLRKPAMRRAIGALTRGVARSSRRSIALASAEAARALEFMLLLGVVIAENPGTHLDAAVCDWIDLLAEVATVPVCGIALPALSESQRDSADGPTLKAYEAIRACPPGQTCAIRYRDVAALKVWLEFLDIGDSRVGILIEILSGILAPMHTATGGPWE